MSAPDATRILVMCDGASAPACWQKLTWDHTLSVNAEGKAASLNLKVENLTGKVVASLDRRAQDLIRIAAGCYGADQMISRGGIDIHRQRWSRMFFVVMPVIDRAFWSSVDTVTSLTEALSVGTDDAWQFHFTERPAVIAQMRLALNDEPWYGAPDCVALFSGGTDSLCAVVEAVAERGRRPVVVSHRPAGHIDRWQRDLLKAVHTCFPEWRFPHMSFWIHKKHTRPSDVSQRTRGFLFAALGAAVAGQIGVRDVLLPDNGYVSINPPISGQLVGALASRGTHPAFLRLFNRLLTTMFATPVVISNPLADRTRAEALDVLARYDVPHLVSLTHTCGKHQTRTNEQPHCGGCSQCVDRRFSTIAAGLAAYDPASGYVVDIFRDAIPDGEARTVTLSYVDFARKTERASLDQLFERVEELIACLDPDDTDFNGAARRIGRLLNRHGGEVVRVLADIVGEARTMVARGEPEIRNLLDLLQSSSATDTAVHMKVTTREGSRQTYAEQATSRVDWNACRHRLGLWHIVFHGEKAEIPHRKGMTQLALLLQSPGQPLDVIALFRQEARPTAQDGAVVDGFTPGVGGGLGEVLTDETIKRMNVRKRELPAEIESARARGRAQLVRTLSDDLHLIKQELRRAYGLAGRRRQLDGPAERARKAVSKTIHEALNLIEVDLQDCRAHLDASLDLANPPVYQPDPRETWAITF